MTDEIPAVNMKDAITQEFDRMEAEIEPAIDAKPSSGRDEKGRFKPKESSEEPTEPAVEQETAPAEEIDQDVSPVIEAEKPIDIPASWSADAKEHFAKLPPDTQKYLVKRESEREAFLTQKSQELAEYKRQHEPLNQILSSRKQAWAMQGMDEPRAISQLLALSDYAANKPEEFIQWFASQRGISLNKPQAGEAAAAASPDLTPVLQRVNSLEQTFHQQQQAETARVINSFATAPGHEHFQEVKAEMGVLLQHGIAKDMEDAYQRSCRANPAVWEKMQQAEKSKAEEARKAADAKRIADANAAAAKAKKAAGTQLSTKASLNGGVMAPASMKESMIRAYDQLHGAA